MSGCNPSSPARHARFARESDAECVLCAAAGGPLCAACKQSLPWHAIGCPRCAAPAPAGVLCSHCLQEPPCFDAATVALQYAFPANKLVQALKFGEQLALASVLASLLLDTLTRRAVERPDAIVPIPLSRQRLSSRGFNQAGVIAAQVATVLRLPLRHDALERHRDTAPQTGLTRAERHRNVRDAFRVPRALGGMRIALVDDVMTTGATLDAASAALKAAGAGSVYVWTVARADHRD